MKTLQIWVIGSPIIITSHISDDEAPGKSAELIAAMHDKTGTTMVPGTMCNSIIRNDMIAAFQLIDYSIVNITNHITGEITTHRFAREVRRALQEDEDNSKPKVGL